MIDTPNISQPSSLHDEDSHGHAKIPFGMRAACVVLAAATVILAYMVFQRNSLVIQGRTQLAQANAEATQSKADLDGARTQAAALQTQLDQARSQQADLQSTLGKLQTEEPALQAQIKNLQEGRSSLQSQLEGSNARATDLQSQLSKAEAGSAALGKQLEAANLATADLKSQLEKARSENAAPMAVKARGMPISTAFKKSFFGGYTMHLANLNPDPLNVTITVEGSNTAPIVTTIASGSAFEVKHLAADANIVIASNGYDSVNLTAR
jgi:peptidoglycan hydrolase CwlO-like protein